jgi:hypothetical protein
MASPKLSRRVQKVVGYPPLLDMSTCQRREFHEALLDADTFDDLPGKWQAAIVTAEQNRPKLRVVSDPSPLRAKSGLAAPRLRGLRLRCGSRGG